MKIKKYPVLKWLFQQYQEGSIQQDQKQLVDEWFEQYNNNEIADILTDPDTEQRIYNELDKRIRRVIQPAPVYALWPLPAWLKVACSIIVVFIIGGVYWLQHWPQPVAVIARETFSTVITGKGEVKQITLDDGTQIWLNSATSIRIGNSFKSAKKRTVYLDRGEAFFEVTHNPARPFSVVSGNIITRDIGTAFNIRAYDLKKEFRLAVASGKVSVDRVDAGGKIHTLSAGITRGQVLLYNQISQKISVTRKDVSLINDWRTTGSIYLDGLTIKQIGEELSRHFNITVTVEHPKLDPNRYTIQLNNQSLSQLLQQLTLSTGITYQLEHDSLTINPSDKRNEVK